MLNTLAVRLIVLMAQVHIIIKRITVLNLVISLSTKQMPDNGPIGVSITSNSIGFPTPFRILLNSEKH